MEYLDGRGRGAHFHGLPGQLIGHAVEAVVELDVIVDVDRGLRPHREIKALGGSGLRKLSCAGSPRDWK